MYRAKPTNTILHLLLTTALLLAVVSLVVAQSSRARNAQRPRVISRVVAGKRPPHLPIGKISRLPASLTRKALGSRLLSLASNWHPRGTSRVAGDTNVPRQTILLTKRVPTTGFTIDFSIAADMHPVYTQDETAIYFDSDRVSDQDSSERPDRIFNIFKMTTDGSVVTQVTSATDGQSKIEPTLSSNLIAYVAGGNITFPTVEGPVPTTSGFQLYKMDQAGTTTPLTSASTVISNAPGRFLVDVRHPSFDPTGSQIAVAGRLNGDTVYHIFTVDAVQGTIVQYTTGGANEYAPAWSPQVSVNNSATVIAFTTNANGYTGTTAPVTSASPLAQDEVYVLQPITTSPSPTRITRFSKGAAVASNRSPAWSIDPLTTTSPNVGNNSTMLGFASTRADTTTAGIPDNVSPNGTTDIYYMNARLVTRNGVTTVATPEVPFNANGAYTGAHKLQTTNPQYALDSVDPQPFDATFTTIEDNPAFPPFFNTNRIAFQSDRGRNFNIWASAILDLDAPTLLKYDENTNEIVRVENPDGSQPPNRTFQAGNTVQFKVRAVDYQSDVKAVYLQIKCPDSAPKSADRAEHKVFYIGPGQLDTTTVVTNPPYEFDSQAIKATASSAGANFRTAGGANDPVGNVPNTFPGFNAFTPGIDDFNAYSGVSPINTAATLSSPATTILQADTAANAGAIGDRDGGYWLPLTQDATQKDMWTATWQTPSNFASDMILDVIVYDNAVYPFDATGNTRYNWKIYDNVWGFTTRPFNSLTTSHTLYVSDYDTGQKFLNSRFGSSDQTLTQNTGLMGFEGTPTESWMTEFSQTLFPRQYISGTTAGPLAHFETPLGLNSYNDGACGVGVSGGPLTGDYDIWRVQCRGPLPDAVLAHYGPRAVSQPADVLGGSVDARPSHIADSCVIWHAPYLGDLFVGPGTLLDQDTQLRLANFVASGGRLFVNGQDVGFGLSLGASETINPANPTAPPPTVINAFLNSTLHAYYLADQALPGPASDAVLNGPSAGNAHGLNPIAYSTWYDVTHPDFIDPTAPENPPLSAPPVFLGYTQLNPTNHDYGCPNQGTTHLAGGGISDFAIGSPDRVQFDYTTLPQPPANAQNVTVGQLYPNVYGIDGYYNPSGANNSSAIIWTRNAAGGKIVFSPIGWECINPDFFTVPNTNPAVIALRGRRVELMHNVLDFLRTGRIRGTVRSRNPSGSVTTVVPNAFVRATRPDPVTGRLTTYGTARTLTDGSYSIEGLDPLGIYNIDATSPGFITQHATGSVFHGAYEAVNDLYITQAVPVVVTGRITNAANGQPVAGAIVQAKDITADGNITDPSVIVTNPNDAVFTSGPSDTNGSYTIRNLPASARYQLTVTNAAALGFSPTPIPPSYIIPDPANPAAVLASAASVSGQDFKLTQPNGTLNVIVKDANGLISTATVTATLNGQTTAAGTTSTFANGQYTLSLQPGVYGVVAAAPGYGPNNPAATATVTSNAATTITITLVALPPGSLSGIVTTSPPSSLPVSGATITVTDSKGNVLATTTTGPSAANPNQAAGAYAISGIPSGTTVNVTAGKSGYTPKPNPDTQSAAIVSNQNTPNVNFILDPIFTFNADLTLVSSPYTFGSQTVADLFSIPTADIGTTFKFVGWDAANQKYLYYPTQETNFQLGQGYFLQDTDPAVTLALTTVGTVAPQDATGNYQDFSVPLVNGWNLIGDPYTAPVDFSKLRVVDPSNATNPTVDVPTAQSGASPLIGAGLYTYEHGTYETALTIDPFRGYWIRAFKPLTLIFSAGAQQSRAIGLAGMKLTHRATDVSNITGEGWKLQLKAQVDDGSMKLGSNAYLGTSRNATDAFDKFKMQVPPSATKQSVQIGFTHKDWGDKSADYMMDIRSSAAKSWEFTVTSNVPSAPVTLTWPGMASLPRRMEAQLTDLDTQQVISMRNRSSVVIPAGGSTLLKRYRLDMAQVSHAHDLQITGLVVAPVNGSGRAAVGTPSPVGISYNLSAPATVKVNILQGTRRIRTIQPGVTRAAGINQLTWDGKTDQGSVVAANAYTVEVTAIDPSTGKMARQIQQVLVTR